MAESQKISDKYIAGFIDADGCFSLTVTKSKNGYCVTPCIRISQKFKTTLDLILNHFGHGVVYKSKRGDYEYQVRGSKAKTVAMRIVKHMVLKEDQARWIINFDFSGLKTTEQIKHLKASLKALRYSSCTSKQFPSRKWLAGYFDGDGCLYVGKRKNRKSLRITAQIACENRDIKALELIHKQFGGSISIGPTVSMWTLFLQPTSAEKFLGYFSNSLLLKKQQAMYIIGWFQKYSSTPEGVEEFINNMKLSKATGND